MDRYVDITFDCLPLRSIGRMDIPLDASPKFRARCERIQQALAKHGSLNTYYLYNARSAFHLTNKAEFGVIEFSFEGTVLTEETDTRTIECDLQVDLTRETCDWLTEPVVHWFMETVRTAVQVEFDRFIAAGDLQQAIQRIERLQSDSDRHCGFVGMYL
jgi:hypothetical protein